jgi:hypothetical protein
MAALENTLIALFILWALASACYPLRIRPLRRFLNRINWGHPWVRWALFNSDDPAVRPGFFEIEFRDRDAAGNITPWTTGLTGFFWSWRSGLWSPERRFADAVHHLGKTIKTLLGDEGPAAAALAAPTAAIERHLRRTAPPPPGSEREFRVVRRISSEGVQPVFTFTARAPTREH